MALIIHACATIAVAALGLFLAIKVGNGDEKGSEQIMATAVNGSGLLPSLFLGVGACTQSIHSRSPSLTQLDAVAQVTFDLGGTGGRELTANSGPRDLAGELVQVESNPQALLARQTLITARPVASAACGAMVLPAELPWQTRKVSAVRLLRKAPPVGLEQSAENTGETAFSKTPDAQSDARAAKLLQELTPDELADVLAILRERRVPR